MVIALGFPLGALAFPASLASHKVKCIQMDWGDPASGRFLHLQDHVNEVTHWSPIKLNANLSPEPQVNALK
jgi:hypothetical protein